MAFRNINEILPSPWFYYIIGLIKKIGDISKETNKSNKDRKKIKIGIGACLMQKGIVPLFLTLSSAGVRSLDSKLLQR